MITAAITGVVAVVAYLATWRDVGTGRALVVAVVAAAAVGLIFPVTLYFSVLTFAAAVAAYAILRRPLLFAAPMAVSRALVAAGGVFVVMTAGAVAVIDAALTTM